MRQWTLDQLKAALSGRKEVKGWILSVHHVHRRERYFMADSPEKTALAVDQDREVRSQVIQAQIFVRSPRPGRQGEIVKKLVPSRSLTEQLDSAIEAAGKADHQAWELPSSAPVKIPERKSSDPRIAEDIEGTIRELTDRIAGSVAKKRPTKFNSAELFVSNHSRELHLSNGLVHRSAQTRLYAESAFSSIPRQAGATSDEFMNTLWSVGLDDFSIEKLFAESAERAEHSAQIAKPATGKYAVIVDAEVLSTLLNGYMAQLSGFNSYSRLPFIKIGDELIPGATADRLTIALDPTLDLGADTTALSDQGILQEKLELVKDGIVCATIADQQYANYLGIAPSASRGSLVVAPGSSTYAQMTKQAPRVLEILKFSALFPDSNSGTFSSEIRLARLYDNAKGTVTYLKGGSLSGSISANFKGAKLSRNRVKRADFTDGHGVGYFGPDYALLTDVSIVG